MLKNLSKTLLLPLALLAASAAHATIVEPLDLETLSHRAHLIVRGRVQGGASRWLGGRIVTVTEVAVSRSLKGQAPVTVEVRVPGGEVGDLAQRVAGAPQFVPGEEVILFLERQPGKSGHFAISGFAQGKFNVLAGLVSQRHAGLGVRAPDGTIQPAPDFAPVAEDAFVERVQRALREQERTP